MVWPLLRLLRSRSSQLPTQVEVGRHTLLCVVKDKEANGFGFFPFLLNRKGFFPFLLFLKECCGRRKQTPKRGYLPFGLYGWVGCQITSQFFFAFFEGCEESFT